LKLIILRCEFFATKWNLFDVLVVGTWLVETTGLAHLFVNPNLFRVMRLLRLVRFSRMVNTIQALDSLQVLIGSIKACVAVMIWSGCVLAVVFMLLSFILSSLLTDYMADDTNPLEERRAVFQYFGTFTRSFITMYELTLGNWVPCTRLLVESVAEWYGAFILIYRFAVGFATVKVITGVFLHETFQVAAMDDELMIMQKARKSKKHHEKMHYFMQQVDNSGDDIIQREEFKSALRMKRAKTWLSAIMDTEVDDGDVLFDLIAGEDEEISLDELIAGIGRLKGPAKSMDLIVFMNGLEKEMNSLRCNFEYLFRLCTDRLTVAPCDTIICV